MAIILRENKKVRKQENTLSAKKAIKKKREKERNIRLSIKKASRKEEKKHNGQEKKNESVFSFIH